jgi:hypothetical protein
MLRLDDDLEWRDDAAGAQRYLAAIRDQHLLRQSHQRTPLGGVGRVRGEGVA